MYALDYAHRNFSFAYKGNYNNIFLFNDEKPPNFEVVESALDTSGYFIPVKEVGADYIYPLINVDANYLQEMGDNLLGLLDVFNTEEPQIIFSSTADYLLEQGYMEDSGINKKLADENSPSGFVEKNIYRIGDKSYILEGNGNDLGEVFISGTNTNKAVKPFIDFDNEIDKTGQQVIVMVSSDGAKIDDAYLSVNDINENEIILFIENMKGSNVFGSSVRVRTGSAVSKIESQQRSIIKKLLKSMDLAIDEAKIVRILKKHVANTEDNLIVYYIKKGFLGINSIVAITLNLPLGILGTIADTVVDAIEKDVRLDENRWRYYAKDGTINKNHDLFLPIDSLIDTLSDLSSDENLKSATKGWLSAIAEKADDIIEKLRKAALGLNKEISEQLELFIKALSKGFKNLLSVMKSIIKSFADFTIDKLLFLNGLVVGIINSILDTVAFIFQIIGFIFNPSAQSNNTKNLINETKATISMFLEIIENGIDILSKVFSKQTLGAILSFEIQVAKLIYKSVTTVDPKKALDFDLPKADSMGYFTGFIVGFIIEEIITAMLTAGTANVAKASQLALKSMKETLQGLKELPVKIANRIDNMAQRGTTQVILLLGNIRKLIDNLPSLLTDLYKWLEKLLLDAKTYLDTIYKRVLNKEERKLLEKMNLVPTSYIDDILTLCPVGK